MENTVSAPPLPPGPHPEAFSDVRIEISGKALKEACTARLNAAELQDDLDVLTVTKLRVMSRRLTDSSRYFLSISEAQILNL